MSCHLLNKHFTMPLEAHPQINPDLLTQTAFRILVADLEGHGNTLSPMHRAALMELVDTFTGYSTGTLSGRKAFPLPAGMGKTSALEAFLVALYRLGYQVPVAVAASKVAAVSNIKRKLLAKGVPETCIGLKHSIHDLVTDGLLPSTGNDSRLFQLVSHSRVRSGNDFALFGEHEGHPRALLVYDETFMRSDSFAFSARALYQAVAVLRVEAEGRSNPGLLLPLVAYLEDAASRIRLALADLQTHGDPHSNGASVEVPALEGHLVSAYRDEVARLSGPLRGFGAELDALLAQAQDTLRVVGTEQGDGVVTARDAVPAALRDVVILDASAPIRELARLDHTVEVVETFPIASLKSFVDVTVNQICSAGGRSSMSYSLRADRKETSEVGQEVADIIRSSWASEEAFLVFTFVKRGSLDMVAELKRDLQRSGIDLHAKTSEGRERVNFLTWGSETSLNGFEHCTSVIMAGVLHRSHLDLAAGLKGQTGNLAEPASSSRIRELVETEIAHCLMQGASRGSCRRIKDGKAVPMRLWFIHKNPAMRSLLDRVMPGAVWNYPTPQHLRKATADSKAARLLTLVLAHLAGIAETTPATSVRAIKAALSIPKDKATERAFSRATAMLEPEDHGWALQGRSLVRSIEGLGFP